MAKVGTRLNPSGGGASVGISLGGKKKIDEAELFSKLASAGITDPNIINEVIANARQTGQISLPTTRTVPPPFGTEGPANQEPFSLGKPAKTRGIALVDKAGGKPTFVQSPYDDISTVDFGVTPKQPSATDTKAADELRRVTTMVKAALKTGQINIGGQAVDVRTKEDIANVLMSAGIDPESDANLAAAVNQFPDAPPPNRFMEWWKGAFNGAAKVGEKLSQPSQNGNQKQGITATNPKTGEKVISYDGGKTWQKVK
jgi:uncharacterized membrane protein YebE (DUF533 family)